MKKETVVEGAEQHERIKTAVEICHISHYVMLEKLITKAALRRICKEIHIC